MLVYPSCIVMKFFFALSFTVARAEIIGTMFLGDKTKGDDIDESPAAVADIRQVGHAHLSVIQKAQKQTIVSRLAGSDPDVLYISCNNRANVEVGHIELVPTSAWYLAFSGRVTTDESFRADLCGKLMKRRGLDADSADLNAFVQAAQNMQQGYPISSTFNRGLFEFEVNGAMNTVTIKVGPQSFTAAMQRSFGEKDFVASQAWTVPLHIEDPVFLLSSHADAVVFTTDCHTIVVVSFVPNNAELCQQAADYIQRNTALGLLLQWISSY